MKIKLTSAEKAQEEIKVRNMNAVIEFCKQTRIISREAQAEVLTLKNLILQQNSTIDLLKNEVKDLIKMKGNIITER